MDSPETRVINAIADSIRERRSVAIVSILDSLAWRDICAMLANRADRWGEHEARWTRAGSPLLRDFHGMTAGNAWTVRVVAVVDKSAPYAEYNSRLAAEGGAA